MKALLGGVEPALRCAREMREVRCAAKLKDAKESDLCGWEASIRVVQDLAIALV
jgi:hypothetical protein